MLDRVEQKDQDLKIYTAFTHGEYSEWSNNNINEIRKILMGQSSRKFTKSHQLRWLKIPLDMDRRRDRQCISSLDLLLQVYFKKDSA